MVQRVQDLQKDALGSSLGVATNQLHDLGPLKSLSFGFPLKNGDPNTDLSTAGCSIK